MNVADRIEQAPACEVINLTEAERPRYTGAGWKLARFEDGVLAGFFDPMELPMADTDAEAAEQAAEAAMAWLANATTYGDVWLVLCSCGQLCEPRRITLTDASALAHMTRVFAEQALDLFS